MICVQHMLLRPLCCGVVYTCWSNNKYESSRSAIHFDNFCQLLAVTLDDPWHCTRLCRLLHPSLGTSVKCTCMGTLDYCSVTLSPTGVAIAQLTENTSCVSLDEAGRSVKAKLLKFAQQSRRTLETRSVRSLAQHVRRRCNTSRFLHRARQAAHQAMERGLDGPREGRWYLNFLMNTL